MMPYLYGALLPAADLQGAHAPLVRVKEVSHSFTCHPHVRLSTTGMKTMNHRGAFSPQLQSITALWQVLISRPAVVGG